MTLKDSFHRSINDGDRERERESRGSENEASFAPENLRQLCDSLLVLVVRHVVLLRTPSGKKQSQTRVPRNSGRR